MRDRYDKSTADLLRREVPPVVPVVVPVVPVERVRAATIRDQISRGVAMVLADSPKNREEVQRDMEVAIGEPVSKATLDAYAAQGRPDHSISLLKAFGLAKATGDVRLFQMVADMLGWSMVPNEYLPAIHAEMAAERAEELAKQAEELRAEAANSRRSWRKNHK